MTHSKCVTEMTQNIGTQKNRPLLKKKKNLKSLHVRVFILGIGSQLIKLNLLRHIRTKNMHNFENATQWYVYIMQGATLAVARWPGATRNWCRATKLLKKSHFGGPIGQLKFQGNDVMRITSNRAECYCHSFSMLKTNTWHLFLVSYGTQCYCHSFLSPFFSGPLNFLFGQLKSDN